MMFSITHLYQLKAWSIIFIKEIDLCWLFIHFLLVSAHHSLLPHLFLEFHLPCDLSWVPGLSLCHYAWACPLHVLLDLSLLFFVSFFLSTLVSGVPERKMLCLMYSLFSSQNSGNKFIVLTMPHVITLSIKWWFDST